MGRIIRLSVLGFLLVGLTIPSVSSAAEFNFKKYLFGPRVTLSMNVKSLDPSTGKVVIEGGDTRCPAIPFTFNWGDGKESDGWFPESHTYGDRIKNYVVKVTAHYSDGKTDKESVLVAFTGPKIIPLTLRSDLAVAIPDHRIALKTRLYPVPQNLTYFNDSFFPRIARSDVEYVLTVAATEQDDFVNNNVFLVNGNFLQVVLRDPSFQGMYSLWFTSPVSFGAGDYGFQGNLEWLSFMHEMGHNFTLNTPSNYIFGGRVDGNANAIYSESMAQIFSHAAAYRIINSGEYYGLSDDLVEGIKENAISSIRSLRSTYEDYLSSGKPYCSWNDPSTEVDETFGTFTTIAYKFLQHAENDGKGYVIPLKRMLTLLQTFDRDLCTRYDPAHDTKAGSTFRATFMVTALSYAFEKDLRGEFKRLNFPIDNQVYDELYRKVPPAPRRILWRDTHTGQNLVWYMDGATRKGSASLPTLADLHWTMAGTGDFDLDGNLDILWRNTATGQNLVWYMDGTKRTGVGNLPAMTNLEWTIVGTGDVNRDGKPDILWRNTTTGQNLVWYMDAAKRTGSASLPTMANLEWAMVGTADVNRDGKPDILWRNTATGRNLVWYMNGVKRTGSASLPTMANLEWVMAGARDFSQDGNPDILWRNTANGMNTIWYMKGAKRIGTHSLPTLADLKWEMVGAD
jgi:hypothetical protein